jgi:hypothetical protein
VVPLPVTHAASSSGHGGSSRGSSGAAGYASVEASSSLMAAGIGAGTVRPASRAGGALGASGKGSAPGATPEQHPGGAGEADDADGASAPVNPFQRKVFASPSKRRREGLDALTAASPARPGAGPAGALAKPSAPLNRASSFSVEARKERLKAMGGQ